MDSVFVSRLQFGLTLAFHYIFVPITIGLSVALVMMEGMYLRTRDPHYRHLSEFWAGIFGLNFALGVVTGIPMEFQFGTNWAQYSRFVGDVFGSALAAEGIFAFFLESGFLAVVLFGWNRVSAAVHFLATILVCLGSHFSAIWIIVANSWMQTPAGFRIAGMGAGARAVTTDFSRIVFNPSTVQRLTHTIAGAWQAGAFLVLSVSAWYLLKGRHEAGARRALRVGLVLAAVAATGSIVTGDWSGREVAHYQPAKLAAMEGVFPAKLRAAPLHLFGWVDERVERVHGPAIPGLLSYLVHRDSKAPITGLRSFPRQDWPPANRVFQVFHLMVAIGFATLALTLAGLIAWGRGTLYTRRWLLWLFVFAIGPVLLANELGWFTAEWGRQPWLVYGLLRTPEGVSPTIAPAQVWGTVALFGAVYVLFAALYVFLLNQKIQHGPVPHEMPVPAEDLLAPRKRAELV